MLVADRSSERRVCSSTESLFRFRERPWQGVDLTPNNYLESLQNADPWPIALDHKSDNSCEHESDHHNFKNKYKLKQKRVMYVGSCQRMLNRLWFRKKGLTPQTEGLMRHVVFQPLPPCKQQNLYIAQTLNAKPISGSSDQADLAAIFGIRCAASRGKSRGESFCSAEHGIHAPRAHWQRSSRPESYLLIGLLGCNILVFSGVLAETFCTTLRSLTSWCLDKTGKLPQNPSHLLQPVRLAMQDPGVFCVLTSQCDSHTPDSNIVC